MDEVYVGSVQMRPLDENYTELAALHVLPNYRRKGIGTQLIRSLLWHHDVFEDSLPRRTLCLVTCPDTAPFYERHGFQVVTSDQDIPSVLLAEHAYDSDSPPVLDDGFVCMLRPNPTSSP